MLYKLDTIVNSANALEAVLGLILGYWITGISRLFQFIVCKSEYVFVYYYYYYYDNDHYNSNSNSKNNICVML